MPGLTTERFFARLPNSPFAGCEQLVRDSLAGSADDLNALLTVVYLRGHRHGREDVCPLGALARYRGISVPLSHEDMGADDIAQWAEEHLGVTQTLAWIVQELADEQLRSCTLERRYERTLAWIRKWRTTPREAFPEYRNQCLL